MGLDSKPDLPPIRRLARRAILTCLFTTLLLLIATCSLFFTTAPAWLSLLVEPLNLLFLPGLLIAVLFLQGHGYTATAVTEGSLAFYLILIYALLWHRDRTRHPTQTSV